MPQTFRRIWRSSLAGAVGAAALMTAGGAAAEEASQGVKFEIGAMGGVHLFASDLELGVADDPTLPSPKSPSGLFGLRVGVIPIPQLGIEAEAVLIPSADNQQDLRLFILGWRAHLVYNIAPGQIADGKLTPFVLAGAGALTVISTEGTEYNEIKKDTDFVFHGGVGAKYAITPLIQARVDFRALGVPNTKSKGVSPDFEIMAGVGFTLGGQAAPPPPPPPPPLVKDTDGDGIPDTTDKCPHEAGPKENNGCPDRDRDGDGVVDRKDKCPDEAGPPEREGCPEKDSDKDGIVDEKDKCPDEPEDKDGFEDDDGCPDLDNDKDGIPDEKDKCPNEPETKNGYQDDDGCPDEVPAPVKKFTGVVKGINFRRNSADIKASSFPLLKEAVKVFKEYPALRIEISGHTSTDGRREFNMKLSQKRAESVKAFLVSAGIEENRISTIGYGPDRPIAENDTKEGQEKNRRIEFRLLGSEEKVAPPPSSTGLEGAPSDAPGPKGKKKKARAAAAPEGEPMPPGAAPASGDKKEKAAPASGDKKEKKADDKKADKKDEKKKDEKKKDEKKPDEKK
jgi:OOP family OmpA-OmpF porin